MLIRKKNVLLWGGVVCFMTLALSSCLKDVQTTPQTKKTYLAVMHLAPWTPAVEIYFDNTKASSAINSGTVSPAYTGIDPKIFSITFKKASSDSVVASIPTDIYDSLEYHTLLLYNDTPAVPVVTRAMRIADDFTVLTNDKAYCRFFHMSPNVPAVDVYLDNTKIFSNRQYTDNIFNGYYNQFQPQIAGSYNLVVKKAGADSVIAQTSTTLYNYNAFTVYLKGLPASGGSPSTVSVGVVQAIAN